MMSVIILKIFIGLWLFLSAIGWIQIFTEDDDDAKAFYFWSPFLFALVLFLIYVFGWMAVIAIGFLFS